MLKKLIFIFAFLFFTSACLAQNGVQQIGTLQYGGDSTIGGTQFIQLGSFAGIYSVGYQIHLFCLSADIRLITGLTKDTTAGSYIVIPAGVPFNGGYYRRQDNPYCFFMMNAISDTAKIYYGVEGY